MGIVETVEPFSRDELKSVELFREVDFDLLEPVLRNCEVRFLSPGESLIVAGEANRNLYLLLSGRLEIRLKPDDTEAITAVKPGESVGEISLIDQKPASASVIARRPSRVLVVDEELVWILVNSSHPVSTNLLTMLARRLRYDNEVIEHHRQQLRKYRFHATIDAVTGLFNRFWLRKMLPRQMARANAGDEPLSLIMADIDHFKKYNDTHGHVAGDRALESVADSLRNGLRPTDMPARYGGEEFIVLLPATDLAGARVVAERLRAMIEAAPIETPHGLSLPSVTVSLGMAEMHQAHKRPESLIEACDQAMYRAKLAGRNRLSE